ncbi:FAD-binding oxidoreductase [Bacillus sp. AGMB 02131]|uniref:FAD-binding oxidoreductase n=1 Tax=Peribacillus faecalis TaxID=2772559 RepID=A0A927HAR2_9BACI|nr:FAD-dependent oxidoreductase [Peribacillus faecalis]MBD3108204.1 FAD-binding oxidoreductase [Peribacillus faecalis]
MDLQSGKFYWPETINRTANYKSLEENIECDVLIIGCGSSGAQCAYYLLDSGLNIAMVDSRGIAEGSTATNTALLQYLGEKFYYELANTFGEETATTHIKLCEQAISDIEKASQQLEADVEFARRDSLYSASDQEGIQKLKQEYELLQKHGFNVEMWDDNKIASHFPFQRDSAILIKNDAEINPVAFTYELIKLAVQHGFKVFEHTKMIRHQIEDDKVIFYSDKGHQIKAGKVIVAAGYETLDFRKHINLALESSYAIVTKPLDLSFWYRRTLLWETKRPYIYTRTTKDNRIIIGGLDETTNIPEERDNKLISKKNQLIKEFHSLFPDVPIEVEYYLAALYGGTTDGLPMIGLYDELPSVYHVYAYGDNGMVYNMVLGKIIGELVTEGTSKHAALYLQTRKSLHGK